MPSQHGVPQATAPSPYEADGYTAYATPRQRARTREERLSLAWDCYARRTTLGFVRGVNDCCTFAAGWASAAMGRTLACAWLGKPLSDEEALAILEEAGGLEAAVDQVLLPAGWQHVSQPNAAPEYAIALLASAGGFGEHTLGIVRATWVVTREEPRGAFPSMLRTMPKSAILQAWEWPH